MVELDDLPDEILVYILKKLYNVEVLYSLIGVNHRLSRIAHDSTFTSHLALMTFFSDGIVDPLPYPILDRFCLQILPQIHDKIKWLNLESSSLERILLATNYPNLYGLSIYGTDVERAISRFTDKTILTSGVKDQISSLIIDFFDNEEPTRRKDVNKFMFIQILTLFTNLKYLNFGLSLLWEQYLSFDILPSTVTSSTLLELHVCLRDFSNCLYLLDGRFNQLHTLHLNIASIFKSTLTINDKEKLPNLRCFSLSCNNCTFAYEELVVPVLHRMLNLEKLDLHLVIDTHKGFVDGNFLKESILNHMVRLNQFTFNIHSFIHGINQLNISSKENIQQTFRDFPNNRIISYVDHFQESASGQCHVYSYPFSKRQKYFNNLTNSFPGGLFEYVRVISLYDKRPFQHDFFLRIAESFPLLERLLINNRAPQNDKRRGKAKDCRKNLSIIEYPLLTELSLYEAHDDYVEQFLVDKKTSLPNILCLCVNYGPLKRVTHNFKRNATRINCTNLAYLYTNDNLRFPKHFKDYFPRADINV